ncbi:hypothetical protein [Terricaulis sp.]|uniref:hypothetical protein n=1 Tax=Terricaulis sp. TaxID=2768686 RepID=UPI0037847FA9
MSPSSALARFWSHARHALTALCGSLMPLDTLRTGELRALRASLRALEAFCRRLALGEALRLANECWRALTRAGAKRTRAAPDRSPALRLWPKFKPSRARIRLLGPPSSVREIEAARARAELKARLAAGRARRKPAHLHIADRIEALQRFLDAPLRGVRALARKLRRTPGIAQSIMARLAPPSPFLHADEVGACEAQVLGLLLDSS